MKYLRYYESDDNYELYGISPEEIKFMFVDLEDLGWNIFIRFNKRLHQLDFGTEFSKGDIKLGLVPSIELRVKHNNPFGKTTNSISRELLELINSDIFKETIEVSNDRLQEYNWKIKSIVKENDYIKILLSKTNI